MQTISILKEIYNFKDQESLSFFLDTFVEGEPSELRVQKYLQFRNQKEGLSCPECGCEKYIKNGKSKSKKIQKYRCKKCGKGFSEFTNTFLFRVHKKEKMIDFYEMSNSELSLEDCRQNLRISKQTAFNWRHKGISALKGIENEHISGIAELLVFEMAISRKGEKINSDELLPEDEKPKPKKRPQRVPKIKVPENTNESVQVSFCCNREHQMEFDVLELGELNSIAMLRRINTKLQKIKFLCIDDNPILKIFAQSKRLPFRIEKEYKKKKERDKKYHTQTIQNLLNGFRTWLSRFRGVATKYLQNYLNWYLIEVQYKGFKQYLDLFMMLSIYNRNGISNYKSCRMFTG